MKQRKLWIFLSGLSGILVFYLTTATVAVFMVLDRIEAETGSSASIFGTWYQTLIFVLDLVFVACTVVFAVLAGLSKKKQRSTSEVRTSEGV